MPPANIDGATFPTCSITLKAEYNPKIADNNPIIKAKIPIDLTSSFFLEKAKTTLINKKVKKDIVKTSPCKNKSII